MKIQLPLVCSALVLFSQAQAVEPPAIPWNTIPAVTLGLFYPGQSTYQWLRSPGHRGASKEVARGDACVSCHDESDAEEDLGIKLVKSKRLEPSPVVGKTGFKELKIQAAYDDKNVYIRAQWKTDSPYPGTDHQYLRFDGSEWKVWGFPKLDKPVQEGKQVASYEDRFSMMIDDGKVAGFDRQGCWLTCHDGQRDNPKPFTKEEVAANALLTAIKKSDVRKYLPDTRTDPMDWKTGKSVDEIARLKAEGKFLDLIQWRAHRSNPVGMADDGYVLEFRLSDAGADMFASNFDKDKKTPKYMWDAAKMGSASIQASDLFKGRPLFLIQETNAVAFDPNAGWKEGDMVPDYVLSRAAAKGSAADNHAVASWKDGVWTVVIIRPLGLTNSDDKTLRAGGVYNVGFAVHDDKITTRGHHVSFNKTLGLGVGPGVKVDINATRLK